jgi:hypothetical protein
MDSSLIGTGIREVFSAPTSFNRTGEAPDEETLKLARQDAGIPHQFL